MNMAASTFDARKRCVEELGKDFVRAVDAGTSTPGSLDVLCKAQDDLMDTPAETLADVVYKVEASIGDVDEVGGDAEGLVLLKRAVVALRAGSVATARRMLDRALEGDAEYEFAWKGAAAAFADLHRLSA
jgi:hypothetical protein